MIVDRQRNCFNLEQGKETHKNSLYAGLMLEKNGNELSHYKTRYRMWKTGREAYVQWWTGQGSMIMMVVVVIMI